MAINFPISPYINQVYTYAGLSWLWNGVYWETYTTVFDIFVTGGTYSSNTFTFTNNSGGTFSVLFNTVTGLTADTLTVTGNTQLNSLTATTISATTYLNFPSEIFITGATYSSNTFTFTNNSGGTFNVLFNTVTGLTANSLTVTGETTLNSLSANTLFLSGTTNPLKISGLTSSSDTILLTIDASGVVHTVATTAITVTAVTLYTSDGTLSGNRVVDIGTNTLNFSSSTYANNLVLSGGNVGINISNPTYALDVNGNINFPMTVSGANGIVGVIFNNNERFIHEYGTNNLFIGNNSGNFTLNTGTSINNIGLGVNTLSSVTTGSENFGIGVGSLTRLTTGNQNVAIGLSAGTNITTGIRNVAIGSFSLYALTANTINTPNTAIGWGALATFTGSSLGSNLAIGTSSQFFNLSGLGNLSVGQFSLQRNVTGNDNTAVGNNALGALTAGTNNTAIGRRALVLQQTGNTNVAIGVDSGRSIRSGDNLLIGTESAYNSQFVTGNTVIGNQGLYSNVTGSSNVVIGYRAGYNETTSNKLWIANSSGNPLISGDFSLGRVGINIIPSAITNTFHISGQTDPLRIEGLTSATDSNFLTIDTSGVVHTIAISAITAITSADTYTTGATYSSNTFTFTNNSGGSFNVLFNTVTGLTSNTLTVTGNTTLSGLTASTISATTYQNLPIHYFISASTPTGVTVNIGDRWYNTNNGFELVYIYDGDNFLWVQPANTPGPAGYSNLMITSGITTSALTLDINTNYYGVSYNGNVNLTLPNPSGYDGYNMTIKDEGGYCGTHRIRLTPAFGNIDGTNYVDMNTNYMALHVVARNNNWWII